MVQDKAEKAEIFAAEVGREKAKVNAEAERATMEAAKCAVISQQVAEKKEECARDLALAIPLVGQAEAALNVLNKKDFNELKAFTRPPTGVDIVCEAAMHLQAGIDPTIDVDRKGRVKDRTWKGSLKMMADPTKFLFSLRNFQAEIDAMRVPPQNVEEARRLKDALGNDFTPDIMSKKAQAAGGLCEWVINIIMYYDIVVEVEPKKRGLEQCKAQMDQATNRHQEVMAQVARLEAELAELVSSYDKAIGEKLAVMAEAERCHVKLEMAQRLVKALSANGLIWEQTVERTAKELVHVPGDALVACSFAAYVGIFTREYREKAAGRFVSFLLESGVQLAEECDPLRILSTESEQARWCSRGLQNDRVSLENGAIMNCSERWCLLIDPQLQGVFWVKHKEAENNLQVTRMGHELMVKTFESAIEAGRSVLIESMGEAVEAVLQPVIARNMIRRPGGRKTLKLGDREINYNPNFKLFMQTKLSNPHYPPEIQAECTVINFTVTEVGLEDQLLFLVVKLERPDLARKKAELIQQQNEYKLRLADLEALLLEKLSSAKGDILEDADLIAGLEDAKAMSDEVKEKVKIAQDTEMKINETSENYRITANRGSLLFFLSMDLAKMHQFYRYSLDAFVSVVTRAVDSVTLRLPKLAERISSQKLDGIETGSRNIEGAGSAIAGGLEDICEIGGVGDDEMGDCLEVKEEEEEEQVIELSEKELAKRVEQLQVVVTSFVFSYLRRGLLDADKLTVAAMLAMRILVRAGKVEADELSLLISAPPDPSAPPVPDNARLWLTDLQWAQLKTLEQIRVFREKAGGLTINLEQDSLGWKRWFAEDRAEIADLPRCCRELGAFHRLFLLRVLRPDRLGSALTQFVVDHLGQEFVDQAPFDMDQTYSESTCLTPLFFVTFPGTDPTPIVEGYARKLGITGSSGRLVNISMGQGQETVAISALSRAAREGGWVMLQNIHLMQSWLKQLERSLELIEEFAHSDFRCVLTSEPPGKSWPGDLIPEAVLQRCIKIADEAPTDMKSNLRRAYAKFSQETIDTCQKAREFKATLFALCLFHALILGRIKFGAQGWSKKYPFNDGDLTICGQVLRNYLNNAERLGVDVPWPDLRYIFGDIMYGGHITDHWDRRVCRTYLSFLVVPELLNNLTMAPGFKSPDASKMEYTHYVKFIDERFPPEQPSLFGLHPNAEIGYLTNQGISIFKTIQGVSCSDSASGSLDITLCSPIIARYLGVLPVDLDMAEIRSKMKDEDYTPYTMTSLQESDRMNLLLREIRGSLQDLELGIGGQLNVSDKMESLATSLQLNQVSGTWRALAYPSLKSMASWFVDLVRRVEQLAKWTSERHLLKSIWISGLFNSMAFLTAVMQVTARERSLPLDYMTNRTMFTNTAEPTDILNEPTSGVHVHGYFLEGASWEDGKGDDEGYVSDSKMKELHKEMPVANVFSVHMDQMDWTSMYHCPVFITSARGDTFVVQINLRMDPDDDERRWVLAGAALLFTDD
eukprot:TRINITY_DN17790_c1_g3_i1.p1 TRINITY_DN17790_c1_g3~~TRINITY_DN17790_c1_g3_i1.p1  ORF type:complete len:1649 (+),score=334.05 TRINITY_DN17790_c1_g3_i1:463-4947(+)